MPKNFSLSYWCRQNLFSDKLNTALTFITFAVILYLVIRLYPWLLGNAVWSVDLPACKAAVDIGACWGLIGEKWRLILFGRYPFEQIWRPILAMILIIGSVTTACYRPWWGLKLFSASIFMIIVAMVILRGGSWLNLNIVSTEYWGGLPLTLLITVLSSVFSFPLGVLLALGRRRTDLPLIKAFCVVYIELVRGVPLISVLFVASFLFPLFLPAGMEFDVLLRVLVGITLFAAAYAAEVIRGGLQAIPKGQIEAAEALGLTYWQIVFRIVLPQALRIVVPPLMNNFIGTFKDTTLVTIVSLFELLGSLKLALADPQWRAFTIEGYIFVALIYFLFCFLLSVYSKFLEAHYQITQQK